MRTVHKLSKGQIKKLFIQKRDSGRLYDLKNRTLEEDFHGSVDRFCDIAFAFRESPRVLDVGSGSGLLAALLKGLGHEVFAIDFFDHSTEDVYARHKIPFQICNVEAEPLPFDSGCMDAISCCQVLEHFTHSHMPAVLEMKRVLRAGGLMEIDVPNAVCFRNRSCMIRGKHITWDYKKHYLYETPSTYYGREYYPNRHNREFTREELHILLHETGFAGIDVRFLKDRRYRPGLTRFKSAGSALRDCVPSLRKSLIAFARKIG